MTIEKVMGHGVYKMTCHGADGVLKWTEETENTVVNVGLQDMNTQYFKAAGYTAAWYLGVRGASGTNTTAAGDTMASHAGWVEVVPYSNITRPVCTFGTATTANPSVLNNAGAAAVFNINATATVGGAFLTNNSTKAGTTGTLFSAASFAAPGDRVVVSGDTITLTYTFTYTGT